SYPVAKKRHSFEFLRTVAHLRPRTNTFSAITRIRHHSALAMHEVLSENGFFWVNTPIITGSDCEGAGELFRVSTLDFANLPRNNGKVDFEKDFFGTESYLTVSGQLNVESYCMAMSRVYTFGPTFRAENSNTSRHLAEFWMIEPEIAFADLDIDAQLAESFLKSVVKRVLDSCEDDIAFFNQHVSKGLLDKLEKVVNSEFVRMEYSDAIDLLKKAKKDFEFPVEWGHDLQSEHERYIAEEYVNGPVIMMNYPQEIKAFYMRANDDGKTCAAMDVLVPGVGELIGGSQREERLDVLSEKMAKHGLLEDLWWYRDLRRYGTVPHAGFGLGFERFMSYITGMENVRDVIPFPRVPNSAAF
ncbi:MAG: asparagine--tRNA ligase, partial [Gammaproteobacteria bacterium]|nr:asparagine--tRNA ligase [Gammaproteobacteria bacterium]